MPVTVRFFRTEAGREPAREYLRSLEKADRQVCGAMLRAVQDYGIDAPGVEKRQLEGKLWELKPDQHRALACDVQVDLPRLPALLLAPMSQVLDEERQRKKK